MRSVLCLSIAYLLFFLGAKAVYQPPPQQQQQQDQLSQEEQQQQQQSNQTPRNTTGHGNRASAVASEREASAGESPPVSGGAGAGTEPPIADGQWYPQPNHYPLSDGASILRSIREMHQMGIPLIRDENLLQQFGIPRAVENPRPAEGGSNESNSTEGSGRPPSSGDSAPSPSSPPASSPTLVSAADLRAVETGMSHAAGGPREMSREGLREESGVGYVDVGVFGLQGELGAQAQILVEAALHFVGVVF